MQNGNKINRDNAGNDRFEENLDWSLKVHGFVFPESDDEVEAFCQKNMGVINPLPEELRDPRAVFISNSTPVIRSFEVKRNNDFSENLAMAAREGKTIPADLLQRMEEDRQRSKKSGQP
ncbi:hypothetical protein [Fibrella arboris]|uniref:hypothetical protein n=1 Tax=Fibrella arboris TaxID=3242486 RepID=UPI00351FC539